MGVSRFLNGFVSGTVCSAFAFIFYNRFTIDMTDEKYTFRKLHAKEAPRLRAVDSGTALKLRGSEILKYGIPDRGLDARLYENHVLCYDQAKKTPIWVAEHITKADLKGPANRRNCNFNIDPTLDPFFTSHVSDYKGSGWSRGHMAPAGDNKYSQDAMEETFYYTNIVPQDVNNNGGFWNRLEMYCRDLTDKFSEVRVISGPLMLPVQEEEGTKKFVKYEVIGNSSVAVPTHLFKVIAAESPQTPGSPVAVGAFIVPNKPIEGSAQLVEYEVKLEELEKSAGIYFLPQLPASKRVDLCSVDSCKLIPQETLELFFITRKLENAETLQRLESAWKDLDRRSLIPDDYMISIYKKKKESLMNK
ncbi:hypothetical protein BSL78_24681 [Apostichopus japonicus]|uniref:Nuclease EXOG, mitochondrial n=1 Tax=Stichopus japonicus TaxID=307972 RepID=A0A2G8JRT7_STIJA|nr:hypothetical protein BSL78_24681 [Apostichopus japonicus]